MANGTDRIKFPLNEPATGRRKSQIDEYLEYYRGPGVQHIALATDDLIDTVSRLTAQGVEFLRVPTTYYDELQDRVGKIDEPIDELGGWAFWSIATTKATCCKSSRGRSRTVPRCFSK